jgi:hypothetical protein
MANRDDYRGYRSDDRFERRRRDERRPEERQQNERPQNDWGWNAGQGRPGDERRTFGPGSGGEQGRFNSDQARYRYGSRFDQDRGDYGSGYDRERGGYGRGVDPDTSRFGSRNDPARGRRGSGPQSPGERGYGERAYGDQAYGAQGGYGGQEYGVESGGDRSRQNDRGWQNQERETWRPGGGEPYGDLELNAGNRGVQEFGAPSDYAYHPHQGHELDPEYVSWRDQRLAGHDRDYQEWRRQQHEQYDNDYRSFRSQRRDHFGKTFAEWRSQQSLGQGIKDTTVAPGVSGYGDRTATNSGWTADPPGGADLSSGQAGGQGGGQGGGQSGGQSGGQQAGAASSSPEFGKEPPQVQAAAKGEDGRDRDKGGAPEGRDAKH